MPLAPRQLVSAVWRAKGTAVREDAVVEEGDEELLGKWHDNKDYEGEDAEREYEGVGEKGEEAETMVRNRYDDEEEEDAEVIEEYRAGRRGGYHQEGGRGSGGAGGGSGQAEEEQNGAGAASYGSPEVQEEEAWPPYRAPRR